MTKTEPHQDRQTDVNPALPHWQATVLTLFPDMFPGHLAHSLAGKSLNEGIWALKTLDIRDFARDKHRTVDDTPLGGGVGMVLKPDVVAAALAAVADCPGRDFTCHRVAGCWIRRWCAIWPLPKGRCFCAGGMKGLINA